VTKTPEMSKEGKALAEKILVDTSKGPLPELAKAATKGAIVVGMGMDAKNIYDNIIEPKALGSGMTPEERNDTLVDLGVNLVGLGISAALAPETLGLSSIPLALTAAAVGTDIGKLANAYF